MAAETTWQQVTLRLSTDVLSEAEEIAALMSTPDMTVVRAEVLRAAVRHGLAVLREEAEAKSKKPAKRAR